MRTRSSALCMLVLAILPLWVTGELTFAVMPKSLDNTFFNAVRTGCEKQARVLGVRCLFTGPLEENAMVQAQMVTDLIQNKTIDGLAVAVASVEILSPMINLAVESGIPVITFDSDAPDTLRSAYVGTDNTFFGEQIGKVLIQLVPNGGTYVSVGNLDQRNILQRYNGLQSTLKEAGNWDQLDSSPIRYSNSNLDFAMQELDKLAELNPTAIVPVQGGPMRSGLWGDFVEKHLHRNMTLVSGDAMPLQLDFIAQGMVDGLVGQLPFEMGLISMQVLFDLVHGRPPSNEIIGTNVLTHIKVPLVLPTLTVDDNLIGGLQYVGYTLFCIVALCCLFTALWAYRYRNLRVVKVAQPQFLIMVSVGILIMASSIIPLSFDDGGNMESTNKTKCTAMCMSTPWLCFIGFTVTFSALFSKTWRINRLLNSEASFQRVTVTEKDVLVPFVIILALNIIVLICWTIIDPLTYVRSDHDGTDGWNRILSTYGACRSENVIAYLIPLAVINVSVLAIANWQAYQARNIQSEFAESKYIGMAMGSMLQASIMGIPILFVVRENPQAFYLVVIFLVFVVSMVTLLLIFAPKIVHAEAFKKQTGNEQRQMIRQSIRISQQNSSEARRRSSFDNPCSESFRRKIELSEMYEPSEQYTTSKRSLRESAVIFDSEKEKDEKKDEDDRGSENEEESPTDEQEQPRTDISSPDEPASPDEGQESSSNEHFSHDDASSPDKGQGNTNNDGSSNDVAASPDDDDQETPKTTDLLDVSDGNDKLGAEGQGEIA